MRAVKVVDNSKVAELLIDPMRRTILSLLADRAMTENHIAEALGLTESAVGHHLRALEEKELVRLVKKEPESHGILQKFYRSSALCFVIDFTKMPQEVSRYFFSVNIERIRGVLSTIQIAPRKRVQLSSTMVEELAELMANAITEEAKNYGKNEVSLDREEFTIKLYGGALLRMLQGESKVIQSLREALGEPVTAKIMKSRRG